MVIFKDGIIHMPGEENPIGVYTEIRSAIYDNDIPLIKVIGFKTVDRSNPDSVRASDRHNAILENMIELSGTFSDLILLPYNDTSSGRYMLPSNFVNANDMIGGVTAGSAAFRANGKSLNALNKELYLFHALQAISIRMVVTETTGFITMEKSVEIIKGICSGMSDFDPNSYFPLNNEFSLVDYVRILPPTNKYFRYKLRGGMTDDILNMLWNRKKGVATC